MGFLDTSNFLNVVYALNIQLETHFANLGLNGDLNRVVYAKKEYCFRERLRQRENGGDTNLNKGKTTSLDFPFMQYAVTNIDANATKKSFNNLANIEGIWLEDLGKKVRIAPIDIEYSLNFFYQKFEDALYAYNQLIVDNSNQTLLYPEFTVDNVDGEPTTFPISAELAYNNINLDQDGWSDSENAWLKTNRIHVVSVGGIEFATQALAIDDDSDVSITEEVIFNFLSSKDGYSGDLDDIDTLDPQTLLTYYFNEDGITTESE
ncbi:MAG: hypothetical protein PQJ44_00265 [Sphaerochaetaceae bacterium]|nr:hypothetical protein [Sphaerochaetaceae bacterium]